MKTFAIIAAMEEELVYLKKIIPTYERKEKYGKFNSRIELFKN